MVMAVLTDKMDSLSVRFEAFADDLEYWASALSEFQNSKPMKLKHSYSDVLLLLWMQSNPLEGNLIQEILSLQFMCMI